MTKQDVVDEFREKSNNRTREDLAHRRLANAVARVRRLEIEIRTTFEELEQATGEMEENVGVTASVHFNETVSAAWHAYQEMREGDGEKETDGSGQG